jgi:hypothetical protein
MPSAQPMQKGSAAAGRGSSTAMVVTVAISRQARDALVDAHWLGEWDEDNRKAVSDAVQRLVDGIQPVTRDPMR